MSLSKTSWKPLRLNYRGESKKNIFWIGIEASLTKALKAKSRAPIRVSLLGQKLSYPSAEEIKEMGLGRKRLALTREVLISSGNDPWVYAKSIMITNSHLHYLRCFKKNLESKGMGEIVFARKGEVKRKYLRKNNYPALIAEQAIKISFSRKSLLDFKGISILLYECFTESFYVQN